MGGHNHAVPTSALRILVVVASCEVGHRFAEVGGEGGSGSRVLEANLGIEGQRAELFVSSLGAAGQVGNLAQQSRGEGDEVGGR